MIPVFDDVGGGTDVARGMWDDVGWESSAEGRERDASPPKTGAERSAGLFFFGKGVISLRKEGGRKGRGVWVRDEVCFAFGLGHKDSDLKMCVLVYTVIHIYGEGYSFFGWGRRRKKAR